MTLMRVRRAAQLTLPANIRRALNIKDGDFLEAQVMREGVLLKTVSVVERKRAWSDITRAVGQVQYKGKAPKGKASRKTEDSITREVKRVRHSHA